MRSMDEIMMDDPMNLTDEELGAMVGKFREARHTFLANEANGVKPRAAPKPKPTMSLDDLLG